MTDNDFEIDAKTAALWAPWADMPDHVADPIGAARYMMGDSRCPETVRRWLQSMITEARAWTGDARRQFELRIIDLVGGYIAHGHDPVEFAAYLRLNRIAF